ncbi:MAG TPA: hypothetical protein VFO52_15465 [Longimicrobiales bacterium]|nr:hypothetical protein [Longimicrobiales bacterium]
MSHLPDAIHVRVTSRQQPLSSLLVLTRIVMHELNDYWGVFGETDSNGALQITGEQLRATARTTRAFNTEDFADLETSMAGLIEVRVLDEPGIERALEAFDALPDYPYPAHYRRMLEQARAALLDMGRVLLEVEVAATGGDCEVKAERPL